MQLVILGLQPPDAVTDQAFVSACAQNRLIEIEHILQALHDPNHKQGSQIPLVLTKMLLGQMAQQLCMLQLEKVTRKWYNLLLKSGAVDDATTEEGTALHLAAGNGHVGAVEEWP